MNIEEYRNYCISKKGVTESFPFDSSTLVFKVMNRMFALAGVETFVYVNLKCDPEEAIELREENGGITGAFHMSKKHWNSLSTLSEVSDEIFYQLIDKSYDLVVKGLTKKQKDELHSL